MAIIRWNPWNLSSIFEDDFELPSNFSKLIGQGLNLYETEDEFIAEAAMPGVSEDKVDVTVDQNIVRIFATTEEKQEEKDKRKYFMSSLSSSYNYSFKLPEGLVLDQEPEAQLHNGILSLKFKKVQKVAPKKVKVVAKTAK